MPLLAVASTVSSSVNPVALEEAECGVGGVVSCGGQQVAQVLEPVQLGQAGTAVAVLGLADERYWRAGGPWPAAARERQDVDLVAHLVLAAGDDGLPDRADGQACLSGSVAGDPLGGECLEMGAEDLGFCGVLCLGPDLARPASFQVGQVRFDD